MKLKLQLLLTLNLLCLSGIAAENDTALNLAEDEMWSINGGVFQPANQYKPMAASLSGEIMVKNAQGDIRIEKLADVMSLPNQPLDMNIYVDRTAPVITEQWQQVINTADGIKVGPNSLLEITVNESEIKEIIVDDQIQASGGLSHVIEFHQAVETVTIVTQDAYDNIGQKEIKLQSDFQAPTLDWQLQAPAILTNGVWFAGKSADLNLTVADSSDIGEVKLNDQVVTWRDVNLQVAVGDVIEVSDSLGNTQSQKLNWQIDSDKPYVKTAINGQTTMLEKSRVTVRVNDLIEMNTLDDGIGLKVQQYKGKSRKWLPLPQKFRFTSKGNFRIKVYSEDLVGNQLEKTIKFKVKR